MSILGTRKLKICSDKLSLNNMDSYSKSQSIIQFIPVNCQPFGMILFNNATDKLCTIKSTSIDEVDIKNHYIDFNGINWCITLAITVFKKMNQQENTSTFHSITVRQSNIQLTCCSYRRNCDKTRFRCSLLNCDYTLQVLQQVATND